MRLLAGIAIAATFALATANRHDAATPVVVHILPHSHMDVGWLKTVDRYYTEDVRYIYSGVIAALTANSTRRFQAVETAYFSRWYDGDATPAERAQAQDLVAQGRLALVGGGWVMHARRDSAEHFFRSNALHCTARTCILIPAQCSAIS